MSILAAAATVIASLGGLGGQIAGAGVGGTSGYNAENIAATVLSGSGSIGGIALGFGGAKWTAMAADYSLSPAANKGFYDGMFYWKEEAQAVKAANAILWAMTIVEILELTTGFGPPHEGDDLQAGSAEFTKAFEQLKAAFPDEHWQGEASHAYADVDKTMQDVAQQLADLDLQLAAIVKNQAEWVNHMRLGFGILKTTLLVAFGIYLGIIALLPIPTNLTTATIFAYTVAGLGVAAAISFIGVLIGYSVENGNKADDLAGQYADVAKKATVSDTPFTDTAVAAATESRVSSFDSISASMSGTSALSNVSKKPAGEDAPTQAGDDASPDESPLSGADGAPAETSGAGSAESPAAPPPAAATVPTLSQIAVVTGQGATLAGNITPHKEVEKKARAQLREAAQKAQQDQEAAARAAEAAVPEVTVAEDTEGAAVGAAAAERAPVEVGAGGAEPVAEGTRRVL